MNSFAKRILSFFCRIFGVAVLSFRAALRTKAVGALLGLLALVVLALPAVIRGDGTPAGQLHILLTYTLGLAFGILCLATLWASCALFAAEIDSSRIQLTAVKPITPGEQWLGKWIALLVLDGLMLFLVYAGVYGQIRWKIHQEGWEKTEHPSSRFVTHPVLPTPMEEAHKVYAEMKAAKKLPKGMSEGRILQTLAEKAAERYSIIGPGEQTTWTFVLERPIHAGEPLTGRILFDTEFSTRQAIVGTCFLRCTDSCAKEEGIAIPLNDFSQNAIEFLVDAAAFLEPPVQKQGLGIRHFTLTFQHRGNQSKSSAIMLRFRQDVVLLTPGGTFEANMVRAAIVQGCSLAVLAALGLALSACFSLPVAAFVATLLLILCPISHSVVMVVSEEDRDSWANRAGIWVSEQVHNAVDYAVRTNPLSSLTAGERIEGIF